MFYVAGIPTYVSMAELATGVVLSGVLPEQEYPEVLAREALRRWTIHSNLSLGYASSVLRSRGDVAVGLSNAGRALIERAHAVLASRRQWVLNEKGMVDQAGLTSQAESLLAATDAGSLLEVVDHIRAQFVSSTNQESQ